MITITSAAIVNRADIADRVHARARARVHQELTVMGESFEREARAIVHSEFERRDGDRHKANTQHLEEMYGYEIIEGGNHGFPMQLNLRTKPGANTKKAAAIEYGADHDYEISPSGQTVGIGGRSVSRRRADTLARKTGFRVNNTQLLRWEDDVTGEEVFAKTVIHRAFPGAFIMRRARDAMLARRHARV